MSSNRSESGKNRVSRLETLAEQILDKEVFTSRHLWSLCQNDAQFYAQMMNEVFGHDFSDDELKELSEIIKNDDMDDGILFYQYLHESAFPIHMDAIDPERLPIFRKPLLLFGDDLKTLDQLLVMALKKRFH